MSVKNTENLLSAIAQMPSECALTPCVGKQNLWPAWSKERLDRAELVRAIREQINKSGRHTAWTGFSLISGPMSGGVMAIDFDGAMALEKYLELGGGVPIPETPLWTSGRPGHFQILLRVPKDRWHGLKPVKLELENGDKLEFRWNQCSTLPPSIHPNTQQPYYWENWDENYSWENWEEFVLIAPDWVLKLMRNGGEVPSPSLPATKSQQGREPSEILKQDILPRLDAQEFYGEFIPKLKRVGKTFKGLCPFHQEKTPSFTISAEEKAYHCFGCGAGGGPVQFLHQIGGGNGSPSGRDFIDIVRQLGDRVGVSLPASDFSPKPQKRHPNSPPQKLPAAAANNIIKFSQRPTLTSEEVEEAIQTQLTTGATGSALSIALNSIASSSGIGIREVRQIFAEKTQEQERIDDRKDAAIEVAQLLASKSEKLNINEILPPTLAEPIERMAQKMNLRPECYLLALLTQCASLLRADTLTLLHPPTDYMVTPNYFGVMIGESGEGKTPVMDAIIKKPMAKLLDKAKSDFEGAEAVYEAELASWAENKNKDKGPAPKPPVRKVYNFTKQTGEGIVAQAGRLPTQGMLYLCDELASLFKSANQYRGGKGSDEEDLLEYWSGGGATVLRAGGLTVDVRNISLSIFGNIQPKILAKFMGDGNDDNGKFARFDFVHQPPTITKLSGDRGTINLSPMLTDMYERLDNLSINFFELELNKPAHDLFTSFYDKCSKEKYSHPKQGMRAMLAKAPAKVGKLATILHCIHATHCGGSVSQYISVESVRSAIKFVRFTINQALSMSPERETTETSSLAPNLTKILELAERKGGTVTVRDISLSFNSKHRPKTQQVREWFEELVIMKYGEVLTKGQSICFVSKVKSTVSTVASNIYTASNSSVDTKSPTLWTAPTPLEEECTSVHTSTGSEDMGVHASKPIPSQSLEASVDTVDTNNMNQLISRIQTAQTWTECEAIWGGNTELKAQIKAALPREELARIGKLFKVAQEQSQSITPEDAEIIRNIALIWWDEYYPEHMGSLIVQMFGWQSTGQRYSQEIINQWLETEDELVRDRITQLFTLKNVSQTDETP
ncbi:MAG: DUF3987 domain-containing protein [Oscillatoriales cyanobacterium]|nr:MAG: DUF3987 domain-containing protein [Oscillatoriales cyanobacterium]